MGKLNYTFILHMVLDYCADFSGCSVQLAITINSLLLQATALFKTRDIGFFFFTRLGIVSALQAR